MPACAQARLSGSIQRVQLDNQMLDAFRPVVLAPAGAAGAGAGGAVAGAEALVRFSLVRSYANSRSHGGRDGEPSGPRGRGDRRYGGSRGESGDSSGRNGSAGGEAGAGASRAGGSNVQVEGGPGEIWSFRNATLDIGALDVQARGCD